MKRLILPLLAVLAAVTAALWFLRPPALPGELKLTFTDGRLSSFAQLRGQPLMLAFWSVNCPACLHDIPTIGDLHRQLAAIGIPVIGVNIPQDPPSAIMATVAEFRPDYPIALDVQGEIARAVGGVDATPMTLFIDPQGRIARKTYGALDIEDARATLSALQNGNHGD